MAGCCGCLLQAGSGISITGTGNSDNPFVVTLASHGIEVINVTDAPYNGDRTGVVDALAAINAAIAALPVSGGTVHLPPGIYGISGPLTVPDNVIILGGGKDATTIKAMAGFIVATPLVTLGAYNSRLQFLTVDANDIASSTCVKSTSMQEGSGCFHVAMRNFKLHGFWIDNNGGPPSPAQFWSSEDLDIAPSLTPNAGFISVLVDGAGSNPHGIHNATLGTPGGAVTPMNGVAMEVRGCAGNYDDIHFEGITRGFNFGTAGLGANGGSVNNLHFGPGMVDGLVIGVGSGDLGIGTLLDLGITGRLLRDLNTGYQSAIGINRIGGYFPNLRLGKSASLHGDNVHCGVARLTAGAVVIATTAILASTIVKLHNQGNGGPVGALSLGAVVAGVSFQILSTQATDNSLVYWELMEPDE